MTEFPFPPEGLQVGELLLRPPTAADVPTIAPAFLDDSVGGEAGLPRLTEREIEAFMAERSTPSGRADGSIP